MLHQPLCGGTQMHDEDIGAKISRTQIQSLILRRQTGTALLKHSGVNISVDANGRGHPVGVELPGRPSLRPPRQITGAARRPRAYVILGEG